MKTGIFGGAFNPVHLGHIKLANNYLETLKLDRIIFIPTANPPHKSSDDFASGEDRFNMLLLATESESRFEISDIEFKRQEKSYTYYTICELKKLYPDDEFYLIIGSDQFLYFNDWFKADELAQMVTLCTASRNQVDYKNLLSFKEQNGYLKNTVITDFEVFEISSSELREMVKNHMSIAAYVPKAVEEYIKEKGLYV